MSVPENLVIPYLRDNLFTRVKPLDRGGFGDIYAALAPDGENVIVKVIPNEKYWEIEENVWPYLHHPNILPLIAIMKPEHLECVMYVAPRHPINMRLIYLSVQFMRDRNGMRRIKKWATEILWALDYLHSIGCCHLDLKSENVLISSDDSAILCDFSGLSFTGRPLDRLCAPKTNCPPEVFSKDFGTIVEGERNDMWLYGLLVLNMLTRDDAMCRLNSVRKTTWTWNSDVRPVLNAILRERYFSDRLDETFRQIWVSEQDRRLALDFVRSFFKVDPDMRPSAAQSLQHPFLKEDCDFIIGANETTLHDDGKEFHKDCLSSESTEIMFSCLSTSNGIPENGETSEMASLRNESICLIEFSSTSEDNMGAKEQDLLMKLERFSSSTANFGSVFTSPVVSNELFEDSVVANGQGLVIQIDNIALRAGRTQNENLSAIPGVANEFAEQNLRAKDYVLYSDSGLPTTANTEDEKISTKLRPSNLIGEGDFFDKQQDPKVHFNSFFQSLTDTEDKNMTTNPKTLKEHPGENAINKEVPVLYFDTFSPNAAIMGGGDASTNLDSNKVNEDNVIHKKQDHFINNFSQSELDIKVINTPIKSLMEENGVAEEGSVYQSNFFANKTEIEEQNQPANHGTSNKNVEVDSFAKKNRLVNFSPNKMDFENVNMSINPGVSKELIEDDLVDKNKDLVLQLDNFSVCAINIEEENAFINHRTSDTDIGDNLLPKKDPGNQFVDLWPNVDNIKEKHISEVSNKFVEDDLINEKQDLAIQCDSPSAAPIENLNLARTPNGLYEGSSFVKDILALPRTGDVEDKDPTASSSTASAKDENLLNHLTTSSDIIFNDLEDEEPCPDIDDEDTNLLIHPSTSTDIIVNDLHDEESLPDIDEEDINILSQLHTSNDLLESGDYIWTIEYSTARRKKKKWYMKKVKKWFKKKFDQKDKKK